MEKAVIYARVSSEEQAKHGFSIENQKKQCTEFAERNGYYVEKMFVDEGKSAKNLDRPEIQDLITYCSKKSNKIKAVIIWRLDRISRSNEDYHGVLRPLFERKGITLLSATEANVDTIEGDLMRNIGMSFAEYERKIIGVRTKAGLRQKAEQGGYPHHAPIGYKNVTLPDGSKTIVIDETRAMYVRRAFELYDSGMYSLKSLTKKLYEDGFRSVKNHRIAQTTIEYTLKNLFYTGSFKHAGKIYENGTHKAIISKELFYRVQERLRDPYKSKKHNLEFAYTGMMTCGYCGCQITAENKRDKKGNFKYVYYHCTGAKGGDCKRDYINELKVDRAFAEIIKYIVIPQDIKDRIIDGLKETHFRQSGYSKAVKANLQREITTLENRIENSLELKLDGNLNHDDWVRYNKKWQAEKDRLLAQLQEISNLDKQFYDKTSTLLGFLDNAYDLFLKGTMAQRRKIMEIISEKIVYKDKNFDIKLRPVFQDLVENNYKISKKSSKNRNAEMSIIKGVEPNSTPNNRKNSPGWTRTNSLPVNSRLLRH